MQKARIEKIVKSHLITEDSQTQMEAGSKEAGEEGRWSCSDGSFADLGTPHPDGFEGAAEVPFKAHVKSSPQDSRHSMSHQARDTTTVLACRATAEVFAQGPTCANPQNRCRSNATVLAWIWNSIAASGVILALLWIQ